MSSAKPETAPETVSGGTASESAGKGAPKNSARQAEKHAFGAETGQLLHMVTHALYGSREVFLRELLSNAADACDRLRFEALAHPEWIDGHAGFSVQISIDKKNALFRVSDNGIGMGRKELIAQLGTIARSGTRKFLEKSAQHSGDTQLIGQFGVGFYAVFMVADKVRVFSRSAGGKSVFVWESSGSSGFTVRPASALEAKNHPIGSSVELHLKPDAAEFLESERVRAIVRRWSNHLSVPVWLSDGSKPEHLPEQLNEGKALWLREKASIQKTDYAEFYRQNLFMPDEPWDFLHFHAEGVLDYYGLLFIPSQRPSELFQHAMRSGVRLYTHQVFITDQCAEILPNWLRFVVGIVDSSDLPLTVSREMLQNNQVVRSIRQALTKRVLRQLSACAEKERKRYEAFWEAFGSVLKEGLYSEDAEHRNALLELSLFHSSKRKERISLAEYTASMQPGQKHIYTLSAETPEMARSSPHIEGFHQRNLEVLLLTDPVDSFWVATVGAYRSFAFRSVTKRGERDAPLSGEEERPAESQKSLSHLIAQAKLHLGARVQDVRAAQHLTDSPLCLSASEGDIDLHLEKLLRAAGQLKEERARILELNPAHPLMRALEGMAANQPGEALDKAIDLLFDWGRILEGGQPSDTARFSEALGLWMARALGPASGKEKADDSASLQE